MKDSSMEILRFWKTQWEAYMKTMAAMQEQGETMLEMIQKSGVLEEGSLNMVRAWAKKNIRQSRSLILMRLKTTFRNSTILLGVLPELDNIC
jgi:hypothetical protein